MKKKIYDAFVCLILLFFLCALVAFPEQSVSAAREGLTLCTQVIIPSLFPFFVISSVAISFGAAERLGKISGRIMRPLFNVSGECSAALILGLVGGYPVGAKTAVSLYERGSCTKEEAERMLGWCNNSGPAFILGVVGAGIFSSSAVGLLLYGVHIIASIATGILFGLFSRFKKVGTVSRQPQRRAAPQGTPAFADTLVSAIKDSFSSVLGICGFVIFFAVVIRLLSLAGIIPHLASIAHSFFGIDSDWVERLLTGLIELSSGVWSLHAVPNIAVGAVMAAFMLGWSGFSVHFQVFSVISGSGLRAGQYILGKLLHALISASLLFLASKIFLPAAPAAAFSSHAFCDLSRSFVYCIVLPLLIFLFFLFFAAKKCRKTLQKDV